MRVSRAIAHVHVRTTKPLIGYTTLVVLKGKEVLTDGLRAIDQESRDIERLQSVRHHAKQTKHKITESIVVEAHNA